MLKKARALIEKGWTKGYLALDSKKQPCSATSRKAKCFCALGAIDRAVFGCRGVAVGVGYFPVIGAMQGVVGGNIADFNDKSTKRQVLAAFDRAIKAASTK